MTLETIRDFIAELNDSLSLFDSVYMGKLDAKPLKALGVYNYREKTDYSVAIGGSDNDLSAERRFSLLVHYNKSPRETEEAAYALFNALKTVSNTETNDNLIYYIRPLYNPQDVGTDINGVCEFVIDFAVIYEV